MGGEEGREFDVSARFGKSAGGAVPARGFEFVLAISGGTVYNRDAAAVGRGDNKGARKRAERKLCASTCDLIWVMPT